MKLDDISLSRKLWISIIGLLFAMLAVGAWAQWRMHNVNVRAAEHMQHQQDLIRLVDIWRVMAQGNTHVNACRRHDVRPRREVVDPTLHPSADRRLRPLRST